MVKAGLTGADGRPLVVLGISDGNVERLRDGKPILVDLEPFGLSGSVAIVHGATESDIVAMLSEHAELPS